MALLSGAFQNPYAGALQVVFSGVFTDVQRRDAGFPSGGTASINNMLLGATVGPYKLSPIDSMAPSVNVILPYPGGSASWTFSTYVVSWRQNVNAYFGFRDITLSFTLFKR